MLYQSAGAIRDDNCVYHPAGLGGEGWFEDFKQGAQDGLKTVGKHVKQLQKRPEVRDFEKKLVRKGATALRGAVDSAAGAAVIPALGPAAAPMAAKAMDMATKGFADKAVNQMDAFIDQSGRGTRVRHYVAGGGMRLGGVATIVSPGLRLSSRGRCGGALRLAGGGHCRMAGNGMYRPAVGLLEGSGTGHC